MWLFFGRLLLTVLIGLNLGLAAPVLNAACLCPLKGCSAGCRCQCDHCRLSDALPKPVPGGGCCSAPGPKPAAPPTAKSTSGCHRAGDPAAPAVAPPEPCDASASPDFTFRHLQFFLVTVPPECSWVPAIQPLQSLPHLRPGFFYPAILMPPG